MKWIRTMAVSITILICKIIWNLSEASGIGLGKLAPHVFGGMIGRKAHKKGGD